MSEIKITFRKAPGYRIIPITGAWGGVNPQGEIVFDRQVPRKPRLVGGGKGHN